METMFGHPLRRVGLGEEMRRIGPSGEIRSPAAASLCLGLTLAVTGFLVWTALAILGGASPFETSLRLHETWDMTPYLYAGVPIMVIVVLVAAFLRPDQALLWPLWLVAGHQTGVFLIGLGKQSGLSLVILTLALGMLLAVGFAVPALASANVSRRLAEQAY